MHPTLGCAKSERFKRLTCNRPFVARLINHSPHLPQLSLIRVAYPHTLTQSVVYEPVWLTLPGITKDHPLDRESKPSPGKWTWPAVTSLSRWLEGLMAIFRRCYFTSGSPKALLWIMLIASAKTRRQCHYCDGGEGSGQNHLHLPFRPDCKGLSRAKAL